MAFQPHTRITMSGTLGAAENPVEIFSTSIHTSLVGPIEVPGYTAAVSLACTTFWGSAARIGNQATLTQVKIAYIGTDGLYSTPPDVLNVGPTAGGGSCVFPYQIARVISLNAHTATRRAKGRFYLPLPADDIAQQTGLTSGGHEGTIAAAVADFFDAIESATGENVVVASSLDGNHPVTTIRVGNVLDTVRRRRNKLLETYEVLVR